MKITYDLNNKEEREEIENYYFFKYYQKSISFDWKKKIDEVYKFDFHIYPNSKTKDYFIKHVCVDRYENQIDNTFLSEVINHLNHHEFNRIIDIYSKYRFRFFFLSGEYMDDTKYLLMNFIICGKSDLYSYKKYLYSKYGNK